MKKWIWLVPMLFAFLVLVMPTWINQPVKAQSSQSENPCPLTVRMNGTTSSTQLITGNGANSIRICFWAISLTNAVSTTAQLEWGTGTTCGSNTVAASPIVAIGSAVTTANVSADGGDGYGFIDENPTRGTTNYCVVVSGSSPVVWGVVKYGLY